MCASGLNYDQRYDELEKNLKDITISALIINLLRCLLNMLELNTCYSFFYEEKFRIPADICMILIRITSQEKELVKVNPSEFVNLALDTCGNQRSGIVKTEATLLLELLCDHIDGSLTFIYTFCCESINYATKKLDVVKGNENFVIGHYIETNLFLLKSTEEEIIETCKSGRAHV